MNTPDRTLDLVSELLEQQEFVKKHNDVEGMVVWHRTHAGPTQALVVDLVAGSITAYTQDHDEIMWIDPVEHCMLTGEDCTALALQGILVLQRPPTCRGGDST